MFLLIFEFVIEKTMEIAKHLNYLLQFHECVIVPEFGGFISNYQPAGYNTINHTFTPPSKRVVFNSKIITNDGLLINHLVDVERLGYRQAQTAVLNFTETIFSQLNKGEMVSLDNLGSFRFDSSGMIDFTPVARFELIEAYGLKPFTCSTIDGAKPAIDFTRPAVRALKHNNNWLKVAAGAAILLSLSMFPLKNTDIHLQSSNLIPLHLISTEKVDNNIITQSEADKTIALDLVVAKEKGPYILVGGSFEFKKNAQALTNELIACGHNAEILLLENGYYRVSIDSYFDKNEALNAMMSYRETHPGSMVWVSTR